MCWDGPLQVQRDGRRRHPVVGLELGGQPHLLHGPTQPADRLRPARGKAHEFIVGSLSVVAGFACQAHDGVARDTDESFGLNDSASPPEG